MDGDLPNERYRYQQNFGYLSESIKELQLIAALAMSTYRQGNYLQVQS